MHACMYVCMIVCMFVRMSVCMSVCMHACMHACIHTCMYVLNASIRACMHLLLRAWVNGYFRFVRIRAMQHCFVITNVVKLANLYLLYGDKWVEWLVLFRAHLTYYYLEWLSALGVITILCWCYIGTSFIYVTCVTMQLSAFRILIAIGHSNWCSIPGFKQLIHIRTQIAGNWLPPKCQ